MDTKGSQVGFNREYSGLQLRYNALKEQVANQIEILNNQVNVVGPNIRSCYMMLVGQFEYRIYELDADIARWKRRFTLRQAALNMGEKPDYLAIERQLDEEFAEYLAEIQAEMEELHKHLPFTYDVLLDDEELLEKRREELKEQIREREESVRAYEEETQPWS